MNIRKYIRAAMISVAPLIVVAAALWQPVRADEDTKKRLVFAEYRDDRAAMDVFNALKAEEAKGAIRIDSYAVLSKGLDGKIKVKDQRQKGTRAGAVVGAVVGLLGGPVGMALGAAAGGAVGYLGGNAVGMPKETINQIKSSLKPGESAIVAVVDDRWADEAERLQRAQAAQVTSYTLPIPPKSAPSSQPPPIQPTP